MSDPVYKWILSLGAKSKNVHSIEQRMQFLCDKFSLVNPGFSKSLCRKIFNQLRPYIERGDEIGRETFAAISLTAVESKKKWDVGHIAFCRSKKFYSSQKWKNLRVNALARGNYCRACGRKPEDGIILHVDHILPRSIYPELALAESNLQILCEDCNLGKGNTLEKRF